MENQLFANKKNLGRIYEKFQTISEKNPSIQKAWLRMWKLWRDVAKKFAAFQEDAGFGMIENYASFPNSMKMPSRKIFGSLERMLEELN